ncbi:MAG: hypothetical protein AAGF95_18765 [Chloroflexota bacterium]
MAIGLGSGGAYLAIRDPSIRVQVPAVVTRPIVQTGGAGDALFVAFQHRYLNTKAPYNHCTLRPSSPHTKLVLPDQVKGSSHTINLRDL